MASENSMNTKFFARLAAFGWCTFATLTACESIAGPRAGQADESFGESGNGLQILAHDTYFVSFASASTPAGEIFAAGSGEYGPAILKLDKNGSLDPDFGRIEYAMPPGFEKGQFLDVHYISGGGLVAAGYTDQDEATVGLVCKIKPSGKMDPMFAEDSPISGCRVLSDVSLVYSIDVMNDARIVASGYKDLGDFQRSLSIVRMSSSGTIDTTFANGKSAAHLPPNYISDSHAYKSVVSADGTITTLAEVGGAVALVRHDKNGTLDETFAGSGALVVGAFSRPIGMIVTPDDSIVLALVPSNGEAQMVTLMKFAPDGSISPDFNGPDSPPGQNLVDPCNFSCRLLAPYLPASLIELDDGRLLLGLSAFYEDIHATRTLSLRLNPSGEPDKLFGDQTEDTPPGVGRSIAVPFAMSVHSSVVRGDRLTVVGNIENDNALRLVISGFLGDQLFSDGFD